MGFNISKIRKRQSENRKKIVADFYKNLENYTQKMHSDFYEEDKLSNIVYTDRLRYLENFIYDKLYDFEDDIPVSFFDFYNRKLEIDHYLGDKYIDFRSGINILSDIKSRLERYSTINEIKVDSSQEINMDETEGLESIYA